MAGSKNPTALAVWSVKDLKQLSEKDNLLKTRGKPSLYPKALVYSFDYDIHLTQVTAHFSEPHQNAFLNFTEIYGDTEELERITEEIFYEGKPARIIEREYCRIIIDLLTVRVCTNYFGCRTASETSTLSWLIFLKGFNSEVISLRQRKNSEMTLSDLNKAERERRGTG